jgi:hypothetical protein
MTAVWVAMSGGVDSSVAAALTGRGRSRRRGRDDAAPARGRGSRAVLLDGRGALGEARVRPPRDPALRAEHAATSFVARVIEPFVDEYARDARPTRASSATTGSSSSSCSPAHGPQGADALATGHYARIERDEDGTRWLERGRRSRPKTSPTSSTALSTPAARPRVFPVGDAQRAEYAPRPRHSAAERRGAESQEVCFVPRGRPPGRSRSVASRPPARPGSRSSTRSGESSGRTAASHATPSGSARDSASPRPAVVRARRSTPPPTGSSSLHRTSPRRFDDRATAPVWRAERAGAGRRQVRYRATRSPHGRPCTRADRHGALLDEPVKRYRARPGCRMLRRVRGSSAEGWSSALHEDRSASAHVRCRHAEGDDPPSTSSRTRGRHRHRRLHRSSAAPVAPEPDGVLRDDGESSSPTLPRWRGAADCERAPEGPRRHRGGLAARVDHGDVARCSHPFDVVLGSVTSSMAGSSTTLT